MEPIVKTQADQPKRTPVWKRLLKVGLWLAGIALFFVSALVLLVFMFEDKIKGYVTEELNTRLNTTIVIDPANIDLTVLSSFPQASVEFRDVTALDALPLKKRDTLLTAQSIALSFSITDIFRENYTIRNITVKDAALDLRIDKKGRDNWHFLKPDTSTASSDTGAVNFALEAIELQRVRFSYQDKRSQDIYRLHLDEVKFSGEFTEEVFGFDTEADFLVEEFKRGNTSLFAGSSSSLRLNMDIDTKQNLYTIREGNLNLGELMLDLKGSVRESDENLILDLSTAGKEVDIQSALSLLPASVQKDLEDIHSEGEFYFDASVKGPAGDSLTPDVEARFGIRNGGSISRDGSKVSLHDVSLKGFYTNKKGQARLELSSFHAATGKSSFNGSFIMKGESRPDYDVKMDGTIDLAEMNDIIGIDTLEKVSGSVEVHFSGSGSPEEGKELSAADFRKFKTSGTLKFNQASLTLKNSPLSADSIKGELSFDGNNVGIKGLSGRARGSDFSLDGELKNLLGYLFTDEEFLDVTADLSSRNLDLNQILESNSGSASSSDTAYALRLPDRLRLKLNTQIRHVAFRRFSCDALSGTVELKERKLYANQLSLRTMDGQITGSGVINGAREDSLLITCNANINKVNISKLFYVFENFGQKEGEETIGDKNVSGLLTSDVAFASVWDNKLNVNEKKIYTYADVNIDQGALINFTPLDVLSRFINVEELHNIKFNTLHNTIEIKNRVVIIPRMEIQSSAVDLVMSGTHDFDNMVDYHFIVSLDELRARKAKTSKKENTEFAEEEPTGTKRYKLYLSMKGPVDDPVIKYMDTKGFIQQKKEEIKQEKQNLKNILNQEFGWFRNDSLINAQKKKEEQKKKDPNTLQFQKKDDEEEAPEGDDF